MPENYQKPLYARVLGWAANLLEEGSFSRTALDSTNAWVKAKVKRAKTAILKHVPKKRRDK